MPGRVGGGWDERLPHEGTASWDRAARLVRHPQFRSEVARYCATLTAPCPGPQFAKLVYQAARFDICLHLIANHTLAGAAGRDVPTLAALKDRTSASDRQVATYVALLRQKRLVAARAIASDRRVVILEPSPTLIREVGRHPLACALSYSRLEGRALVPQPDPGPVAKLIAAAVRIGVLTLQPAIYPKIAALAAHDCGYLLLLMVMLAHYRPDGAIAEARPSLAYATLAERFGVSKTHVANVLRQSRTADWFAVHRGGALAMISADLVSEFEQLMAAQMSALGTLARRFIKAFA